MQESQVRVLVVDDTFSRDGQIGELLDAGGFEVRVVGDHVSGLGALDIWQPGVVVVNLRAQARAGRLFCVAMAERAPDDQPPCVFVAEAANLLKRGPLAPAGLVATPLDSVQLVTAVNRAARMGRSARTAPLAAR